MITEANNLDSRIKKAMDTIKQADGMLTVITVKSNDDGIRDIVDTATKALEDLKKTLNGKIDGYQKQKEELVGKEL